VSRYCRGLRRPRPPSSVPCLRSAVAVASVVEILATFSGAATSFDAPPFDHATTSPGIACCAVHRSATFTGSAERLSDHLRALRDEHGVSLPLLEQAVPPDGIDIDPDLARRLRRPAEPGGDEPR
jgi:hypothetical protein